MPKAKKGERPTVECPADVREIRLMAMSFWKIQELRIELGNRIAMLRRDYGPTTMHADALEAEVFPRLERAEEALRLRARAYARQYPIFTEWIETEVKGVAETLTAGLIAGIRDIGRFDTVSKLWRYCGVGLREDGTIQKRVRGQKIDYSPFLKTLSWKLSEQFVRIGDRGYYGLKYQEFKAAEEAKAKKAGLRVMKQEELDELEDEKKGNTISAGHIHNRAKRKTVKLFISHLWEVWRTLEGLPTQNPWVCERYPQHHYEPPPGWEGKSKKQEAAD